MVAHQLRLYTGGMTTEDNREAYRTALADWQAQLEKLQVVVSRDQGADVEFAGRVKTAEVLREWLAQQPVGTNHGRTTRSVAVASCMIDNEQMVTYRVIAVDVAACEQPSGIGNGGTFLVKYLIAELLRLTHFGRGLRQPHFQRPDLPQGLRGPAGARIPRAKTPVSLQ